MLTNKSNLILHYGLSAERPADLDRSGRPRRHFPMPHRFTEAAVKMSVKSSCFGMFEVTETSDFNLIL
jgi:hypothetical protein